jgi:protocatechuate 3,4-dioxygenase beta subunit
MRIYFLTAVFMCLLCVRTDAGTTGKITGQVTDEFGRPLPVATVLLEHNKRGAETDEEGIYFILSIEPGRHTLVAHIIGDMTYPINRPISRHHLKATGKVKR